VQAPTLHAAISSRMGRCLHAMRAALAKMQPDLDPLLSGTHDAHALPSLMCHDPGPGASSSQCQIAHVAHVLTSGFQHFVGHTSVSCSVAVLQCPCYFSWCTSRAL
jgi:hypothetical protein